MNITASPDPTYIKIQDAARQLQMSDEFIREEIVKGKLKAYKVGHRWRIQPADWDAYCRSYVKSNQAA